MDFSSRFIKLFQLIDIMSTCYHSPVHCSVVMETAPAFIANLINLINFNIGFIIPGLEEPFHQAYNKISRHNMSQYTLAKN